MTPLRQVEQRNKSEAISTWKRRTHSGCQEVSTWLKSKNQDICSTVINIQGEAAETWHDGARAIHEFWDQFGNNLNSQIPTRQERSAALIAGVTPNIPICPWCLGSLGTHAHIFWECPQNAEMRDTHICNTLQKIWKHRHPD